MKAGRGDGLASADRAAAWGTQAGPFPERKTTLQTIGRFHRKSFGSRRFGNVIEMVENISFLDAEQFRNLAEIERFPFQGLGNLFPQGYHLQLPFPYPDLPYSNKIPERSQARLLNKVDIAK